MKYLKRFKQICKKNQFIKESNQKFDGDDRWVEYDPADSGISAKRIWRYPISSRFNCLVRMTGQNGFYDFVFYFEDIELDRRYFMDYLYKEPISYRGYRKLNSNNAIEICKDIRIL